MKIITKTRVEDGQGLVIQLDRGRIKYSENGKNTHIEIEHGDHEVSIYIHSLREWFPPYQNSVITEDLKMEICNKVQKALLLLGISSRVE